MKPDNYYDAQFQTKQPTQTEIFLERAKKLHELAILRWTETQLRWAQQNQPK
jgi:hypothetical protein